MSDSAHTELSITDSRALQIMKLTAELADAISGANEATSDETTRADRLTTALSHIGEICKTAPARHPLVVQIREVVDAAIYNDEIGS